MKVVCAWHKKNFGAELAMGEKPPFEDKSVTHGICPVCAAVQKGTLRVYNECPQCHQKGLYKNGHRERCRYCDLKRTLTPVGDW